MGEGDAGEVYRVVSLLDGRQAILKRPRRDAFTSDIFRQSAQIKAEASILKALSGITFPDLETRLSTPTLLDECPAEDSIGERFFIVIEQAAGINLKSIWQIRHYGLLEDIKLTIEPEDRIFTEWLTSQRDMPQPMLVRILSAALALIETIHSSEVRSEQTAFSGLLWNDVKPEHLYWSPTRACLTVIDWGNGQYLERDGATKDRQFSRNDDYRQFIQEMGSFIAEIDPELHACLNWPAEVAVGDAYTSGILPLLERIDPLYRETINELHRLRGMEIDLYSTTRPELEHLSQCNALHDQIMAHGEIPDLPSAINMHARVALQMAVESRFAPFQQVCEKTARLAPSAEEKWRLLAEIAAIALQQTQGPENPSNASFTTALAAGVVDDWSGLLWELFSSLGKEPLPEWWSTIYLGVRRNYLQIDPANPTPGIAISRLFFTLQTSILAQEDKNLRSDPDASPGELLLPGSDFLKLFKEEVVNKWREIDPSPPNSGIEYDELDTMLPQIETLIPGTQDALEKIFTQPKAQVDIVMAAWQRKDFELARRGLQKILFWDPDRRRLLRADQAIASAPQWLAKIQKGPGPDKSFYNYLSAVELAGRNLRNRVGPADWLDAILDVLKRLRKGSRSADVIMDYPELLNEIPWLNGYRSREILSLPRTRPLSLEHDDAARMIGKITIREAEGRLGAEEDIWLAEPLDTWVPESRGSSARVYAGSIRKSGNQRESYAIKIMRPDSVEYALPLFREEAQILSMLRDVPGITPLVECGYILLEQGMELPAEEHQLSAEHLRGQVVRFGVDEVQNYLAALERYTSTGWLPYLALVKRSHEHNLMKYCDAGYNHGWFLPLRESLILATQICDILQSAHDRNIVYRDHKILHYYWDPEAHGVVMIDWNIARRLPQGLSDAERQFDLAQFGARALHHILTGRPAVGALPLGPNRPEDIERAALRYNVSWTYDDERLPNRVKEILEQVLNQGYTHVRELQQDLAQVYEQAPDSAANPGSAITQA